MALQSSGPISLANIAAEFGDAQPHSLSEFYRGGGKVPDAAGNSAVPTSGAISLGNFYGAVNRVAINITLSANQTNYVLNTAKAAGYVAGVSDITLTINSGVYVSANSTGAIGLDVDTSWNAGDTVTIVNNGFIVGMGGAGGRGAQGNGTAGVAGSGGGLALRAQRAVSVNNAGTIAGGGGGGGGGGGRSFGSGKDVILLAGGGGGGGRTGATNSAGGAAGWAGSSFPGQSGTSASGGTGGAGQFYQPGYVGGDGGAGGAWGGTGVSGAAGAGGTVNGAAAGGGSAGAAVSGNGNISWIATGTRLGAIT